MTERSPLPRVFATRNRNGLQATAFIAGGTIYLFVIIFFNVIAATAAPARANDQFAPGVAGGLSVVGIALIARGVFLLRKLVRVTVDDAGLVLEGLMSRSRVAWPEIQRLERNKRSPMMGGKSLQVLTLIGANGKKLGEIPESIEGFDELAVMIIGQSSATQARTTYDPATDENRKITQQNKKLRWVAILFGLFTFAMGAAFVAGVNEELHNRKFATEGVHADARIDRHYMVAVTPRLAYTFTDAQGKSYSREAMMDQEAWEELSGKHVVPVVYLRSSPTWNHLVEGEQAETSFGGKFLVITGLGFIFFGICFVLAAAGFDLNSDDGVTTLMRRGRVIRAWGRPRETSLPALSPEFDSSQPQTTGGPAYAPSPSSLQFSVAVPAPPPLAPPITTNKPKGVIALGILAIIFGVFGLLLNAFRILVFLAGSPQLPAGRQMIFEPSSLVIAGTAADALMAFALAIIGIGLLMMRQWARRGGIVVAALQVLSSLIQLVVAITMMADLPEGTGQEAVLGRVGAISAVFGVILGMIFPTILLLLLARKTTADAMAAARNRAP